jgi:hypothetical protein
MGRKPRVLQGTNEETPAKSGNNVPESLVLAHLSKIQTAEKKKDEAVAALRAARKAAKADGVNLKTLDAVRHLAGLDDVELASMFNETVTYARYLSVPVFGQMQLFEAPEVTAENAKDIAFAKGLKAGKLGRGEDANPYDPGVPSFHDWLKGQRAGQEILYSGLGRGNA